MLLNILFAIFIVLMAIGTYYQVKTSSRNKELHSLQMENAIEKNTLLKLQIKEQKAKQHLYEDAIRQIKEGK